MAGNLLHAYLPDRLNVIFFPLFGHLPVKTGMVLTKSASSRKLYFRSPLPIDNIPFLASPLTAPTK
jgi:hypothetical protein